MAKNYTTWMLLVALMITFNFSYAQSNHTVVFTGNPSDFNEVEKIAGDDYLDYYVTYDDNYFYFGAFNPQKRFRKTDNFTIYLDVDPQPIINSGNGTTTGAPLNGNTPTLPFNADHRIIIQRNSGGETAHHRFTGSAWEVQSTTFNLKTTSEYLEIQIPKSAIDNPKGIYFSMFITKDDGGFTGFNDTNYPIKFDGDNSTGYFGGIGVNAEGVVPTQYTNTPILHSLTNTDLTADGKYAHIDINDGYYSVTGDIELVAGGTATIAPGSALTVDGKFTNNGLVTLQSTSISYSSLIPTTIDGSGTAQYNRHVNRSTPTGQNDLISAPLSGQSFGDFAAANGNIVSNPNNPAQKLFGPFDKITGEYQTYYTDNSTDTNTILAPGIGYRTASTIVAPSTSGGSFTFTGTINTGTINVPIQNDHDKYPESNLIGNPYPSYISIEDFLDNNANEMHPIYFGVYAYTGSNPEKWTIVNRSNSEELLMAPGQGFLVLSKTPGGTISFDPDLRTAGNTDDFIPLRGTVAEDKASLRLMMSSSSTNYHTEIYFNRAASLDFDSGYESGMIGNPSFAIYTKLVEDIENYNIPLGIQALPYSILSSEVVVPVGIKASAGQQLTISGVDTPNGQPLPSNVEVYFEDNVTNTSTLLNDEDYIFTPNSNLSDTGRFTLRFTNKPLSVNNPNFDGLQIYSPLNSGSLIVKGQVDEKTSMEVFDINGRLLQTFSVEPKQTVNSFELSTLSSGIYIVKLKNKTQSKIKKIQINR